MCTRILSRILALTTLFAMPALSLEKAPLAEKLPGELQDKQPLAYFGFDQKGRGLNTNHIESPHTIQLRGVHYTPEGLDHGAIRFTRSAQVKVPLPATTELTFSAWFLPTGLSRQGSFAACALQLNQQVMTVNLHQNGNIRIQQSTPFSQGSSSMNLGRGIPENQWLHLALVATPQQFTLYLNGQYAGSFSMPVPLSRAHLVMAGQAYRGNIDEVALFKQSLTAQDIQALFAMHKPALMPGVSQLPQGNTWEAKAGRTYAELTRAINSENWSAAATQATAVSDLVATYLQDQEAHLTKPAQEPIKDNLTKAANLLNAFHLAIEQAKYHEASNLFDRLDELWETLEDQLNLPVSHSDALTDAALFAPGMQQYSQFSQTWSSNSGAMSGGGFGGGNTGAGGGFSMSARSGPDGRVQFNSSGMPGQGFMGQSSGQMPPQMIQHQILMHCQRIQMTLMPLRMSLQNGNWQMAHAQARRLSPLLSPLTPPDKLLLKPNARTRRRTFNLTTLPAAQQAALKTTVQKARGHIQRLDMALEKQQLEAAYTEIKSLETIIRALSQSSNSATPFGKPPEE
ncbi:MAG: LamG domain-containing protein [Planctomycetes bacterium]|nr:LamG domain-containing protein [Planctomycetota bacterium]